MEKLTAADPETHSADLVAENLGKLRALFPEAFTEGGVDFAVLRELLGGAVNEQEERYGLNWHGKRRARQMALTPSTGTLRPCPEESVDWETTRNLMIEGDNLEVLKLLQKSYAGKVKLIYIDPPYNTGNDFVYPDDFKDNIRNYLQLTGQVEGGKKIGSNTEASGRFHTDWLNMMYPRLKLAKGLLKDDGLIFVTIDDVEHENLRRLCDEIFGEENFIANIVWQKRYVSNATARFVSDMHDHVVVYGKNVEGLELDLVPRSEAQLEDYKNHDDDKRGVWRAQDLSASKPYQAGLFTITGPTGQKFSPPPGRYWRCNEETYEDWLADNRITFGRGGTGRPMLKAFLSESKPGVTSNTWWSHDFAGHNKEATLEVKSLFDGASPFDTPKPVKLVRRMLELVSGKDYIVLDFFAGSGTTAHSVMELNAQNSGSRRFILVQLPEATGGTTYPNIADITKDRIRRSARKIKDANPMFAGDLGFRVFKLASSNIRAWEPDRANLAQTLEASVEHLKTDRTEQDILFELLLKLGLDLTVPIETKPIAEKTVHAIGAGALLACLAEHITREEVEPLAMGIVDWQKELAPAGGSQLVFRDSAFADDVAKTNLSAILEQHDLKNIRSL